MIDKVNELYKTMLSKFKGGISNTSTSKFNDIKKLFREQYNLSDEDVYATGAGSRPGNLEVRLSQGVQATKHTSLCLAFLIDTKNTRENREKLVKSTFVTIRKSLGRGKSSYDNILIFIDSDNTLFASGLMYTPESNFYEELTTDFDIEITRLADDENTLQPNQAEERIGSTPFNTLNLDTLGNTIIYGPPGTGKTFKMQEYIALLNDDSSYFNVTFHQSFSYEEFVEGLKPVLDGTENGEIKYRIEQGLFKSACEKAVELAGYLSLKECIEDDNASRKEKLDNAIADGKFVLLCIDEINRGNVASIFGELISLIEESKRLGADYELTATLPYSQQVFGVPSNLKIIGTMNTADRSIQLLDSAIRRRFKFEELLPNYDVPFKSEEALIILKRINARIRSLLNKDSQIGHSYLMNASNSYEILQAIVYKVIPLLEEYFYTDNQNVRFVLNESAKSKHPFFKEDKEAKEAYNAFISSGELDDEDKVFFELDSRIKLISDEAECRLYLQHLLGEPEEE